MYGHTSGVNFIPLISFTIEPSSLLQHLHRLLGFGKRNVFHGSSSWLLSDRLNTRNILRRRGKHLDEGYSCVLYHDNVEETVLHLFFDCTLSTTRWFILDIHWGVQDSIYHDSAEKRPATNTLLHGFVYDLRPVHLEVKKRLYL